MAKKPYRIRIVFLNSQISDLSSGSPSPKRSRRKSSDNASSGADQASTVSMCNLVSPCSHEAKEAKNWSVEQVCRFVSTVEHCQPFVEVCIKVYSHQKYLSIKPKCSKTFTVKFHSKRLSWTCDWFKTILCRQHGLNLQFQSSCNLTRKYQWKLS